MGLSKAKMQAIMLDTKLECNMGQIVMQYAWTVHNLYPLARNASRSGQGPRPLTQISNANVDESECDRRIEYAVQPGTWAYVLNALAPSSQSPASCSTLTSARQSREPHTGPPHAPHRD